jgi:hypothetical protein
MHYLVEMTLADSGRSSTPEQGLAFIEQYVLPSLELCKELEAKRKIVAGGPMSGRIGFALVVEAETALELDEIIEGLPIWPRMETTVVPLTTFDGRIAALRPRIERLRSTLRPGPVASTPAGPAPISAHA